MDTPLPSAMNPKELAEYFSISKRTVYRLVQSRQIPFCKIQGQIRFRAEDMEKFLKSISFEPIR
ncbi:MAG: helix-turn-helix domain-containing protein [Candidatus Pacebacteria bacterium]|nr:helix-turn-helix domain-containing protein [Candidatus Paceibacterota bacterium]